MADQERQPAASWLLSDKSPDLLPTPWLSPYEFEVFTEALLRSEKFLAEGVRRVVQVERWGTSGDKQDGIDLFGRYSDGVLAAWQCKHLEQLRPFEVRDAIAATTFTGASEFNLVFVRTASAPARAEMHKHPGWQLIDRGQLTSMLRELPPAHQRDLLERFWGQDVRRLFLRDPGDNLISVSSFVAAGRRAEAVLNDLGPMIGRDAELNVLAEVLESNEPDRVPIILVTGIAGRGKSRLVAEALTRLEDRNPHVRVVCLAPGRSFTIAAMRELPTGRAVIFVEDAHVDPSALAPLLAHARSESDVQVVLASRPSAQSAILEQVVLARMSPSEVREVRVGELSQKESARLIQSLTTDLQLPFPFKNYLAGEARQTPYVAVIAVRLIRDGKLTASMKIDPGLRTQVLGRLGQSSYAKVDGQPDDLVERVLATIAALAPVPNDDDLVRQIAGYCRLDIVDLARLLSRLIERGVVALDDSHYRVVPDVLADYVLERAAAYGPYDRGFVAPLWLTFGQQFRRRLATRLGELDWRLSRLGGPKVMEGIWDDIRARLDTRDYDVLIYELAQLAELSSTQPAETIRTLDGLRIRIDCDDADGIEPVQSDDLHPWGRQRVGWGDVRAKMPELYASAAINDIDQLEGALDGLWALRRRQHGAPHSEPTHAQRMFEDRLANLSTIRDESFPRRIIAKVAIWLDAPSSPDDAATPLAVLRPLLAKEVLNTAQTSPRQLAFQHYQLSPAKVRPIRDGIRTLLLRVLAGSDLRRVGDAIDLLSAALRPPHGYFGEHPGDSAVLGWEDDDLATIDVLASVVRDTELPVVRWAVRAAVAWIAEHASSPRLRHASLELVADVDRHSDVRHQVAGYLVRGFHSFDLEHVEHVPKLEELVATEAADDQRLAAMSEQERKADRDLYIQEKVEAHQLQRDRELTELTESLLSFGDPVRVIDCVDAIAATLRALRPAKDVNVWALTLELSEQAPTEMIRGLVISISARPASAFDHTLHHLLRRWLEDEREGAIAWIIDAITIERPGVKIAIAEGVATYPWHSDFPLVAEAWRRGAADSDPAIAQAFLASAGSYLRVQPEEAVGVLIDRGVSEAAATRALEGASRHDGEQYGSSLSSDDAHHILRLIRWAGHGSFVVQQIISGIASTHPILVLNYLLELGRDDVLLIDDVYGLKDVYSSQANVLADWLADHLGDRGLLAVLGAVTDDVIASTIGTALESVVESMDVDALQALVEVLGDLGTWPLDHTRLADAVIRRSRHFRVEDAIRAQVRAAMRPRGWGTVNGFSDDLNAAVQRATVAVDQAADLQLALDLRAARERLVHLFEHEAVDFDEDTGWE